MFENFLCLTEKEKKLCEKFKDTCLMLHKDSPKSVKQATKDYNKAHHMNIDYRYCAVFRYINLWRAAGDVSNFYSQIIILK